MSLPVQPELSVCYNQPVARHDVTSPWTTASSPGGVVASPDGEPDCHLEELHRYAARQRGGVHHEGAAIDSHICSGVSSLCGALGPLHYP